MSEHSGSDSDEGPSPQSPLDLYQFNKRIQTRRQATHARDAKSTVNVKTFLLCRARASRGSAFGRVPDAICRLIAAIAGGCFVPADGFRGRREGCVFKLGGRGLGYYPDFAALERDLASYHFVTILSLCVVFFGIGPFSHVAGSHDIVNN